MQDCLTDVMNDAAAWHGEARARAALAPHELQFMQKIRQDLPSTPQPAPGGRAVPRHPANQVADSFLARYESAATGEPSPYGDVVAESDRWRDRVRSVPDIRPALLAMDDTEHGIAWSSAFSLAKADLEPWTSFFSGYKKSRLFAEPVRPAHPDADDQPPALQLQFEVQAILELRGLEKRFVLEPPVQISQPAEYLDLITEIEACRDPAQAQQLAKVANEIHDRLLTEAADKGREMGDRLYHALLGPDCTNLSIEWQRLYQRKPSVDELCYMLTTGRIKIMPATLRPAASPRQGKPSARERHAAPLTPVAPVAPVAPTSAAPARELPPAVPAPAAAPKTQQHHTAASSHAAASVGKKIADETSKHNRFRKILRNLCQFTLCCAALAMHAFAN